MRVYVTWRRTASLATASPTWAGPRTPARGPCFVTGRAGVRAPEEKRIGMADRAKNTPRTPSLPQPETPQPETRATHKRKDFAEKNNAPPPDSSERYDVFSRDGVPGSRRNALNPKPVADKQTNSGPNPSVADAQLRLSPRP